VRQDMNAASPITGPLYSFLSSWTRSMSTYPALLPYKNEIVLRLPSFVTIMKSTRLRFAEYVARMGRE
jgi:hypothetical protein